MSADAWRKCPQCQDNLTKQLNDTYEKIPAEEYLRLASSVETEKEGTTFREDYEVFLDDDGEFYLKYHGECIVCGLSYEFKHTHQVYVRKYEE